ncbi:MAG: SDR family oxidoreductase [Lachnospiraceae bacterium]|nr:SDR family oxidoreductase [Lachnospiraceae bacterium]
MGRLTGKTAVVTGASSGMGKEIVTLYVKEGANVVAVARRKERLEELAESLKGEEGKVAVFPGDISSKDVNEAMIDFAVEQFGQLDILVNNAGVMDDMAAVGDFSDDKLMNVFNVNVYGPFYATRKAVNTFKAQGTPGSIVSIASEGAYKTCAGVVYCASKSAVVALSRNTAYMYKAEGIRSNCIIAGGFKTEIANSMGMPNMEAYGKLQPVLATSPEPGEPIEIARAALFLASDEATYISGAELAVDGGWCAS